MTRSFVTGMKRGRCKLKVVSDQSPKVLKPEGILKVCKSYLSSPLACSSGVTGSDLKGRIEAILLNRGARDLDVRRRLFPIAAGGVALIGPIAAGILGALPSRGQTHAETPIPVFKVVDRTKLPGKFCFHANLFGVEKGEDLKRTMLSFEAVDTLRATLPEQLGLKLEAQKASIQVLVIDHANKNPTENQGRGQEQIGQRWKEPGDKSPVPRLGTASQIPPAYSSLVTTTLISAVTSRCSRTGTLYSPSCLMGSSR